MKAGLAADPRAAVARLTRLATQPIPVADQQYLAAHGAELRKAQKDSPGQWQRWWWICFAGQAVFLPFVFIMGGRWSPARAREDAERHEAMVQQESATL
jgi:hypothetical protein